MVSSTDRAWILQALALGISILVSVDPESVPDRLWDITAASLFDGNEGMRAEAVQ
jgi:hypothetical protein